MYLDGKPLFLFGYGMSYTTFEFDNFKLNKTKFNASETIKVSFDIKNVGDMDGMEVAQVYIKAKGTSKYNPTKQLKAFEKVNISSGEQNRSVLKIPVSALASYNNDLKKEVVNLGEYQIMVGNSSEDIFFNESFSIHIKK